MTARDKRLHVQLQEYLAALKLTYFLEHYAETLDEAARKNTSMLEEMWISEALLEEVTARPNTEVIGGPQTPTFDAERRLEMSA